MNPIHYIIGFSGFAGVGKDECSLALVEKYDGIHTGLADPAKRHIGELYGFTEEQLFGPSEMRNVVIPEIGFSAREALQRYMEFMQKLRLETWIEGGIRTHKKLAEFELAENSSYRRILSYSRMGGIVKSNSEIKPMDVPIITTFSDIRWPHDVRGIRKTNRDMGSGSASVTVRVKRPSIPEPPFDHPSETKQMEISDEAFDFIIRNDGSLEDLHDKACYIVETLNRTKLSNQRTVIL